MKTLKLSNMGGSGKVATAALLVQTGARSFGRLQPSDGKNPPWCANLRVARSALYRHLAGESGA
jgi:hypothetical protein